MKGNWILLHRKFLKWEWWSDSNMVSLFIYLLLSVNYEQKKWKGIDIKRGELITGINSLNRATGISVMTIRTCLKRLKSTGEITIKSTNKYSVITITNYGSYQLIGSETNNQTNNQTNKQLTNNQQTTNKQLTTTNKDNEYNKDNKDNEVYMGTDISFPNFYNIYDKKVGYKKCLAKWNNGTLSKEKKKLAIDYLPAYKQAEPDKKFRQNPLTYLNSETWNDELIKEETIESKREKIINNIKNKRYEKEQKRQERHGKDIVLHN